MAWGISGTIGRGGIPNQPSRQGAKAAPVRYGLAPAPGVLGANKTSSPVKGFSGPVRPHFGPGVGRPARTPVQASSAPAGTPGSSPGGAAATTQADPRDAAYWANTAANQFKVNNQINQLQAKQSQAGVSLQDNLAKLAQAQAAANTKTENAENAAGGFALGNLSQNLGTINQAYLGQQQAANQNYANLKSGTADQIAGLQGGVPIYNNQQLAAAVARASANAAKDNTLGLPATPTTPAPAAKPAAKGPVPIRVKAQPKSSRKAPARNPFGVRKTL